MEQGHHWMWTKQNNNNHHQQFQSSSKNSTYYDSWEEKAFAEDAAAAGSLGGCIWPPRSYSCSFCSREFRSAQALGGHMNVHRRDRAKLKQSPTTPPHNENQEHQQIQNSFLSLRYQHNSTSLDSSKQKILESSFVQENQRMSDNIAPSSRFWSKLVYEDYTSEPIGLRAEDGCMKTDSSSVNLSLVPDLSALIMAENIEKAGSAAVGCKRKRLEESSQVAFIDLRSSGVDCRANHVQSEVLKLCPSCPEDLDLELRLGDRPKVN